jgi:TPR repeat protein
MNKYLVLFLLFYSVNTLLAQKRGEPNLDDLKPQIKAAKDGDIAAMLVVATRCKGGFFAPDEIIDYKQAKKWYNEVIEKDPNHKEANLGLFKLYAVGGYGLDKEDEVAKQYFRKSLELHNRSIPINFPDNTNIDLVDFYSALEKAQVGSAEDMLKLARLYYYYEISFREAVAWAEKAKAQGSKDAAYLLDSWMFAKGQSKDINGLIEIQNSHAALGSSMAVLPYLNSTKGKKVVSTEDAVSMTEELLKSANVELKIKTMALLSYHFEGKRKIMLLRQLKETVPNDKKALFYCEEPLLLLEQFDNETKQLINLFEVAAKYNDMRYLAFSKEEFAGNYEGKIDQLVKIRLAIFDAANQHFMSKENLLSYDKQLKNKALDIVGHIDNISKFVAFKQVLTVDSWLKTIANDLQPIIDKKMQELGVTNENLNFYYEKFLMEEKQFKTIEEGKRYYYRIKSSDLDSMQREKLLSLFKSKLLNDVFGSNRDAETIEKLRVASNIQGWLLPEVQQRYLALLDEKNEAFMGVVDRNDIRYHFSVTKDEKDPNKYKIEIRGVKNEEAHLVYSGLALVQDLREKSKEIRCKVYFVINENGATWRTFTGDFLETSFLQNDEYIKYKAQGKMASCADPNHQVAKDNIAKSMMQYDFSIPNALKTSIKVMILEYNKVLLPL